jgi:hypothetical protein
MRVVLVLLLFVMLVCGVGAGLTMNLTPAYTEVGSGY